MPDISALPLPAVLALFLGAALTILAAGSKLASAADRLADAAGLGEAATGAIVMGAITSLAGIITSVAAAARGLPEMAVSNALGGIAVQTAFLVVADFFYRRANLEHAAVSLPNLMDGAALVALIAVVLAASAGPDWSLWGVHPVTPVLFAAYLYSRRISLQGRDRPLWRAEDTRETRRDQPDSDAESEGLGRLLAIVATLGGVTALAGFAVAQSGVALITEAGLKESLVGAAMTAIATSTPELVTTVAAVRRGALQLAVGGIIGGNTFDVLFVGAADIAYRDGSIYHAMGVDSAFLAALTLIMTAILILGLLRREPHGVANIGFESMAVLVLYLTGLTIIAPNTRPKTTASPPARLWSA